MEKRKSFMLLKFASFLYLEELFTSKLGNVFLKKSFFLSLIEWHSHVHFVNSEHLKKKILNCIWKVLHTRKH